LRNFAIKLWGLEFIIIQIKDLKGKFCSLIEFRLDSEIISGPKLLDMLFR